MRMSSFTSLLPAVVGAASIALFSPVLSTPADAYSVTLNGKTGGNPAGQLYDVNVNSASDIGRTLDPVKWLVPKGLKGLPTDLTAEATIKVENLTSSLLELSINLMNTTTGYTSSITSFGFGVTQNISSVQLVQQGNETPIFTSSVRQNGQQNFPGGFKGIDICIFAANNCDGGNVNQGLQSGAFDSFKLIIRGQFDQDGNGISDVTMSDFPLKFQTAAGSFEPAGVPEPLTLAGSGLALGVGALLKKQAAKRRNKEVVKS